MNRWIEVEYTSRKQSSWIEVESYPVRLMGGDDDLYT